jgi:murein DD-endopeptidase MepM/ murein hydrolase activator NlpD
MTLMRTLERLGTGILLIALLLLSHMPADGALASADRAFTPAHGVFTPVSGSLMSASGPVAPGSGILTTGNTVLRSMSGVLTPTVQAVVSASGVVAPTVQAVASVSGALTPASQAVVSASGAFVSAGDPDGDYPRWAWPLDGAHEVTAPYRAPAHEYGPGHRGIDLASAPGSVVHAPADGVVAFRGIVVDRALLTIEHPGGYVSTFEPLTSDLSPGDVVSAGQPIGTVAIGGHAVAGTLHLGVRLGGVYINPMLLFGDVPRAVLLPCCAPL